MAMRNSRRHSSVKPLLTIGLLAAVVAVIVRFTEQQSAMAQSSSTTGSSAPHKSLDETLPKPSMYSSLPPKGDFEEKTTESPAEQTQRRAREARTKESLSYEVKDQGKLVNGQQETMHLRIVDTVSINDGTGDTDELPIHSYIILVGTISAAKAFVSQHRTSVYSDFQITLEQVLQGDPTQSLFSGDTITAERWGGSIHFASGHVKHFLIQGHGFPAIGKRYVFFLSRPDPNLPEYLIATAYDISTGVVLPLDDGPQRKFESMKADDFLALVQEQIALRGGK